MKRQTFLAVFVLMFCFAPFLFAASVGPSADVGSPEGWWKIPKIGKNPLKASYVYEYETRDLRPRDGDPTLRIHWNLAKLALDLGGRVEPYVELGSANILTREPVGHASGTMRDTFDFGAGFAWGVGAKIILFQKKIICEQAKPFQIFADGKFRRVRAQLDRYVGQDVVDGSDTMKLNTWQAAIGVSQEFKVCKNFTVTPYFGGKYSDVDAIDKGTVFVTDGSAVTGKARVQSRRKFGPFVGADFGIGPCINLFVEGRFVDENSVSTGVTIRI